MTPVISSGVTITEGTVKAARLALIGLTMLSTAGCVFERGPDHDRAGYYQPRSDLGDMRDRDHDDRDHGPQGRDYQGHDYQGHDYNDYR